MKRISSLLIMPVVALVTQGCTGHDMKFTESSSQISTQEALCLEGGKEFCVPSEDTANGENNGGTHNSGSEVVSPTDSAKLIEANPACAGIIVPPENGGGGEDPGGHPGGEDPGGEDPGGCQNPVGCKVSYKTADAGTSALVGDVVIQNRAASNILVENAASLSVSNNAVQKLTGKNIGQLKRVSNNAGNVCISLLSFASDAVVTNISGQILTLVNLSEDLQTLPALSSNAIQKVYLYRINMKTLANTAAKSVTIDGGHVDEITSFAGSVKVMNGGSVDLVRNFSGRLEVYGGVVQEVRQSAGTIVLHGGAKILTISNSATRIENVP